MALFPTSSLDAAERLPLLWVDEAGAELAEPPEWTECLIALPWPAADLGMTRVTCNGEPLGVVVRRIGFVVRMAAEWPRRGPGRYHIFAVSAERSIEQAVTVRPSKVTEEEYKAVLDELEHRLPALVALGIQRAGGLVGFDLTTTSKNTVAQELRRLERAIRGGPDRPGLKAILPRLAGRYRAVLARRDRWTPRERVARLSPAGLVASIRRPGNLGSGSHPLTILEPTVEHEVDVYENQVVKSFTHQVAARLRTLRLVSGEAAQRRDALEADLVAALRPAVFLDSVSLPKVPPQRVTMTLTRVAEYRAAFQGLLEFRRSALVQLDEPRLEAPLENFPSLYQTWCTLHVVAWLLERAVEKGYRLERERLVRASGNGLYVRVLPNGHEVLRLVHPTLGVTLRVVPERTYGATGRVRSLSFPQRPDISIEISDGSGSLQLFLLDPKYKLDSGGDEQGLPLKSDIDKMHAYRDAIRCADGEPVVELAATMYPGASVAYGSGVAAIAAIPATLPAALDELLLSRVFISPE